MRVLLTVVDGPALVWNGAAVHAPADVVQPLRPGTTLFAECRFGARGLELSPEPNVQLEFVPSAQGDDGLTALITSGEYDAALRLLERRSESADTLAFRARALLERHRDHERRTTESEAADLEAGAAALRACLVLGGPDVVLDAPNSPWTCWLTLRRRETRPLSFSMSVELLRWVWRAIPRSPLASLTSFSPFMPLLARTPAAEWPKPPWFGWGLAPAGADTAGFAMAMCARLERQWPDDEEVKAHVRLVRSGERPRSGARAGRRAVGLLKGLHVALHSSRPRSPIELGLTATDGLPPDERASWFTMLNEALAIGDAVSVLRAAKPPLEIELERVLFRGIGDRFAPVPSISLLTNGRLVAVLPSEQGRRPVVVLGDVDEVVAAMPEPLFPTALVAVREGLAGSSA